MQQHCSLVGNTMRGNVNAARPKHCSSCQNDLIASSQKFTTDITSLVMLALDTLKRCFNPLIHTKTEWLWSNDWICRYKYCGLVHEMCLDLMNTREGMKYVCICMCVCVCVSAIFSSFHRCP